MENSKNIKCSNPRFPEDFLPWPLKELERVCFWLICVRCVPLLWGLFTEQAERGHLAFLAVHLYLSMFTVASRLLWAGNHLSILEGQIGAEASLAPDAWVSAGVRAAALGKAVPAFPKGPRALLQPRWFQFEAFTRCWSWIEFLPWNQQDLLQHFAWIKIFVPFFFFFSQGRRRTPVASEGRKLLQGPTEVGHVRQLLMVYEEENSGPQTWSTTLSKCLWAAQEKHPSEAYLITSLYNRLNVRAGVLEFAPTSQGRRDAETEHGSI